MTLEPHPADLDLDRDRQHQHQQQGQDHEPSASAQETSETPYASSFGPFAHSTPAVLPSQFPRPTRALTLPPRQPLQGYSSDSVPTSLRPGTPGSSPLPSPRNARSQSLAASLANQSPIRRKPLSPGASPVAIRFSTKGYQNLLSSSSSHDLQQPEPCTRQTISLDDPTLYEQPPLIREGVGFATSLASPLEVQFEEDSSSRYSDSDADSATHQTNKCLQSVKRPDEAADLVLRNIPDADPASPQTPPTNGLTHSSASDVTSLATREEYQAYAEDPESSSNITSARTNSTMSLFARKSIPLQLDLDHSNINIQSTDHDKPPDSASSLNKPLPRSPPKDSIRSSRGLGTFFGWGGPSPSNTEVSNRDYSPNNSPLSPGPNAFLNESPVSTQASVSTKAHVQEDNALGYIDTYLPTPNSYNTQPASIIEIEEMEEELKAISAELASSIRREMELEDLVERLQGEISNPQAPGKRTSDYFSDSGYSSTKYSEYDQSREEVSQIQRKAEQEKAQIRLDLTSKLQDERSRRTALDQQIKELAEKASAADAAQMTSKDADVRVKDLEKTCEDLRRRLSDERQVKDNFEDLLAALKAELQDTSLERDNLRDEIVPQLRARVEGLESQAAENEKLTYETTKMQQELESLKKAQQAQATSDSITRLRSSSVTGQGFKLQHAPIGLGRSNTVKSPHAPMGLGRSNTVKSPHAPAGLSRSNTVAKSGQHESREALAERLKDVEAQRDALHSALKNLLERQEFQNRETDKKIQTLEGERERLLSASPRKANFEKEVSTLRGEVTMLRRRAEEAIEQKWQVEKGLIGLKSDLDRAEEEIASLRALLQEKDILIPDSFARFSSTSASGNIAISVTSASLEKAHKDLQASYREALDRIRDLEIGGIDGPQDERTKLAMMRLEQSLATAMSERDDARLELAAQEHRISSLQSSETAHLESERDLADQLRDSANRVEELTQQVRSQLAVNATLRTRLSDTVARGEAGQKANKERLANMQNRMRILEEQVIAAQTAAEERVTRHEEELSELRDASSQQLQRLRDSSGNMRSPRLFPGKSPLTPLLSPNSAAFPRMLSSSSRRNSRKSGQSSAAEMEKEELAKLDTLKARVAELEKALVVADFEMQEVVGRMNTAQIEVMTLQEERETAARETRKLQKLLEAEKAKAFEQKFQALNSMVAT